MNFSRVLTDYPAVDLVVAVVWAWSVCRAWTKDRPVPNGINSPEERALGATVITSQLGAIITGASIIIAGLAAFVALGKGQIEIPQKYHLMYAAIWSVGALGISLYTMSLLPTRAFKDNFTNVSGIAVLCAMALFFALAGGVRLLLAMYGFLFSANPPQLPG